MSLDPPQKPIKTIEISSILKSYNDLFVPLHETLPYKIKIGNDVLEGKAACLQMLNMIQQEMESKNTTLEDLEKLHKLKSEIVFLSHSLGFVVEYVELHLNDKLTIMRNRNEELEKTNRAIKGILDNYVQIAGKSIISESDMIQMNDLKKKIETMLTTNLSPEQKAAYEKARVDFGNIYIDLEVAKKFSKSIDPTPTTAQKIPTIEDLLANPNNQKNFDRVAEHMLKSKENRQDIARQFQEIKKTYKEPENYANVFDKLTSAYEKQVTAALTNDPTNSEYLAEQKRLASYQQKARAQDAQRSKPTNEQPSKGKPMQEEKRPKSLTTGYVASQLRSSKEIIKHMLGLDTKKGKPKNKPPKQRK